MKSSTIERDHVREFEVIAIFGAARLVRLLNRKFEIRGGSDDERQQASAWFERFLGGCNGLVK